MKFKNSQNECTRIETMVASGRWDECVLTGDGHEGTFWGDENVLYVDLGEITWVEADIRTHYLCT